MQPAFTQLVNLASERLGAVAIAASDDFFAPKECLVKDNPAVFKPDEYTDRGKWMDGWESRRRRTPGHDWCIVKLAMPGRIVGIDVDTSHFIGNHPPQVSLESANIRGDSSPSGANWISIVEKSAADENTSNYFRVDAEEVFTHVRLNIFPDGGVARLRVYGEVAATFPQHPSEVFDLSSVVYGGRTVECSDEHFGKMSNLLLPDTSINMGDGWETRRRRGRGNDWVIAQLGCTGMIDRVEIHTTHFKGNYPASCSLDAAFTTKLDENTRWVTVSDEIPLEADAVQVVNELQSRGPFSHVRLNIFPDGGVARLRVFGTRGG